MKLIDRLQPLAEKSTLLYRQHLCTFRYLLRVAVKPYLGKKLAKPGYRLEERSCSDPMRDWTGLN